MISSCHCQLSLFSEIPAPQVECCVAPYQVSITPEIRALLDKGAVVAIGVSGGKDSKAVALRLAEYLKEIGHTGPKVLIHSDLGRVEWKTSLSECERLASRLGWELMVVRRAAGDLMDRWLKRWENNVERYKNLSCVKLILPWSTPQLRFCTSELKTFIVCSALSKRFPGQTILSVTGVRHQESAARAKMPIAQVQPKLSRKGSVGYNWNAIIEWPTEQVYSYLEENNEPLHEAYTKFGSTRLSCTYCIMGSMSDLQAAASCESNHAIYQEMVELEIASTFGLQGSRWLGDVAPHILTEDARLRLLEAKERARMRVEAEARLAKHLLYSAGWPTCIPTFEEAELLGAVRRAVASAVGIEVLYTNPKEIQERYAELLSLQQLKNSGIPDIELEAA